MMFPSSSKRAGFSLLEMLVTGAITVLLLGLSVPVFLAVRRSGDRATCVANLRAIGHALHQYMSDHQGKYPPNRQAVPRKYPSEALIDYVPIAGVSGHLIQTRRDAGPWFCPADRERDLGTSAKSYGQAYRLGASKEMDGWATWWERPVAAEKSSGLIYMIDHNLLRLPLSTAGTFSEKSWPLQVGASPVPPAAGSGEALVDFDRHHGVANALFVDGSVRPLTYSELHGTRLQYVDPTR